MEVISVKTISDYQLVDRAKVTKRIEGNHFPVHIYPLQMT